jgi:hypothetical protein
MKKHILTIQDAIRNLNAVRKTCGRTYQKFVIGNCIKARDYIGFASSDAFALSAI